MQLGLLDHSRWRFTFPLLCFLGGAVLLTHTHVATGLKQEFLIEVSHAGIALCAVLAGIGALAFLLLTILSNGLTAFRQTELRLEVAFPRAERLEFERRVIFPAAQLDAAAVSQYYDVLALVEKLSYAGNEAARRFLDGEIDRNAAIDWLEKRLGPYPFDSFGVLVVDNDSGMETQTMVTLGDSPYSLSEAVLVHEIGRAHV